MAKNKDRKKSSVNEKKKEGGKKKCCLSLYVIGVDTSAHDQETIFHCFFCEVYLRCIYLFIFFCPMPYEFGHE